MPFAQLSIDLVLDAVTLVVAEVIVDAIVVVVAGSAADSAIALVRSAGLRDAGSTRAVDAGGGWSSGSVVTNRRCPALLSV